MIIPKTVNEFLAFFLEPESKIISFTSHRRIPHVIYKKRYMKIRTKMKNPSAALHGTLNLGIRRYMKIKTKIQNHPTALNVTPNLKICISC